MIIRREEERKGKGEGACATGEKPVNKKSRTGETKTAFSRSGGVWVGSSLPIRHRPRTLGSARPMLRPEPPSGGFCAFAQRGVWVGPDSDPGQSRFSNRSPLPVKSASRHLLSAQRPNRPRRDHIRQRAEEQNRGRISFSARRLALSRAISVWSLTRLEGRASVPTSAFRQALLLPLTSKVEQPAASAMRTAAEAAVPSARPAQPARIHLSKKKAIPPEPKEWPQYAAAWSYPFGSQAVPHPQDPWLCAPRFPGVRLFEDNRNTPSYRKPRPST